MKCVHLYTNSQHHGFVLGGLTSCNVSSMLHDVFTLRMVLYICKYTHMTNGLGAHIHGGGTRR